MVESIELKRVEVEKVNNALLSLKGSYGREFKYFLSKNKKIFEIEIELLKELRDTKIEAFRKYEELSHEIIRDCIEFDKNGEAVRFQNGSFKIKEDKIEEFKARMMLLDEEYKDAIEARKKEGAEIMIALEKTVALTVTKISNKDIPEELTQEQYDSIFPLIKDEE